MRSHSQVLGSLDLNIFWGDTVQPTVRVIPHTACEVLSHLLTRFSQESCGAPELGMPILQMRTLRHRKFSHPCKATQQAVSLQIRTEIQNPLCFLSKAFSRIHAASLLEQSGQREGDCLNRNVVTQGRHQSWKASLRHCVCPWVSSWVNSIPDQSQLALGESAEIPLELCIALISFSPTLELAGFWLYAV